MPLSRVSTPLAKKRTLSKKKYIYIYNKKSVMVLLFVVSLAQIATRSRSRPVDGKAALQAGAFIFFCHFSNDVNERQSFLAALSAVNQAGRIFNVLICINIVYREICVLEAAECRAANARVFFFSCCRKRLIAGPSRVTGVVGLHSACNDARRVRRQCRG